jgi:hypothetical protein
MPSMKNKFRLFVKNYVLNVQLSLLSLFYDKFSPEMLLKSRTSKTKDNINTK